MVQDKVLEDALQSLAPQLVDARKEIDQLRRLPEAVVEELKAAGLFRLALPTELNGQALPPAETLKVLEKLAFADAATAWIVWNNNLPCYFGRFLGDAAREKIFASPGQMFTSSTRVTGKAIVDGDGFRVSGRWSLVSGCVHADWIAFLCVVEQDGEVQMVAPGAPDIRIVFVPKTEWKEIDTWHASGLRGTGSNDIVLDEVPVPLEYTASAQSDPPGIAEPIGRVPVICTVLAGHAAICLGIVGAALDSVTELGRTKVAVDPSPNMRDRPATQRAVAEAASRIDAHRAHLHRTVDELWQKIVAEEPWGVADQAAVYNAAGIAQVDCKSMMNALYEVSGTTAVYSSSVIGRCLRDMQTASQHVAAQPMWMEDSGRVALGLDPANPLYLL